MKRFASFSALALTLLAGGSAAWAENPAEKEAEAYMQTWEERGREACKDNERGCAAAGHALDRAAAAYVKAGRLDKAMAIRRMILDPQWHLDYTDYGRAAAFALARNHQSLTDYAEAAQLMETAVRRFAKSEEAPEALTDAFVMRLALGEPDRALEDLQLFSKNYGAKRPAELTKFILALGTDHWEKGRLKDAVTLLEKQMSVVDSRGTIETRTLTHALLGRLYAHGGKVAEADGEFKVVLAAWQRPENAIKQLDALGGTEDERLRRLGKVLTAVGEAMFYVAEKERAEADAIRFPEYTGPGNKDSVVKFISTHVSEWMKKKRFAVEAAEIEYQKILQIQPAPPPRWVIAAASRVGFLWSAFASDFRRAPVPKEWQSSALIPGTTMTGAEVKKIYLEQMSSVLEPVMQRAKAAFRLCADYSVKFQYADEHSRSCVAWLEKNVGAPWVAVTEFAPTPRHHALPVPTSLILPQP